MRRDLPDGGFVELEPEWLEPDVARRLEVRLRDELAWEAREIVLFGKRILQPRLVAWAGDVDYRYSGQTVEPRPFGPTLRGLVDRVVERVGVPYNHVLANRYRDGNDSMGMHSDDEPELGPDPVVCSVSFGVARRFVLAPRQSSNKGARVALSLTAGSLLVMGGTCQRHYRHGIPKEPDVHGERISLTLRHVLRSSLTRSADEGSAKRAGGEFDRRDP
ncbi:MAG TPA: alpha-ketoglutarate-dependent dioxygenase AlkB [Polyangiaceae bacterium]|jgi:alkylated DNA repair dioxygenase AlkB|nr:alpha-ketoglutarate-dependent dioxygenase AlkB [Polyangiaceae bacterium]